MRGMGMYILVTYDVSTETTAGRRRLRKVATICLNYGQRVQLSVFECQVSDAQYEALQAQLLKAIDKRVDNLRFYKLLGSRDNSVEAYGVDRYIDFNEPLIL
jgi:CRISPR-associated protein Cas2